MTQVELFRRVEETEKTVKEYIAATGTPQPVLSLTLGVMQGLVSLIKTKDEHQRKVDNAIISRLGGPPKDDKRYHSIPEMLAHFQQKTIFEQQRKLRRAVDMLQSCGRYLEEEGEEDGYEDVAACIRSLQKEDPELTIDTGPEALEKRFKEHQET